MTALTVDPAVTVRPWRATDAAALRLAGERTSVRSLHARFFTGTTGLPRGYLRHVCTADRDHWDAVVAVSGGDVIGWAEWGRREAADPVADLGVLVVDGWQRRGTGRHLVEHLLPRSRAAGIDVLHADVQPTNVAAQRALAAVFGPAVPVSVVEGVLRYTIATRQLALWRSR